jgi:hypothetical protein
VPANEEPHEAESVDPRLDPRRAPGEVGPKLGRRVRDKPWSCVFVARSGGRAQAVFATKAEAKQFAERHAHSFLGVGTPLTWTDADHSSVLTTHLGEYFVTSIDN